MNALITGGSKGIGKSLVEKFSQNGYEVFTCGRNAEGLELLKSQLSYTGHKIHTLAVDLSVPEGVDELAKWIKLRVKSLDLLIHNSGVFLPDNILSEDDILFDQTFNLNVRAPYLINKRLYPLVKISKGHIISIASVASETPFVGCGTYVASKHALLGYAKVLRELTKTDGVKVTTVLPGATFTSSWEGSGIGLDRIMSPEAVAEAVWSISQLPGNALVEEITLRPLLGDL